jgi:hypothetical protein
MSKKPEKYADLASPYNQELAQQQSMVELLRRVKLPKKNPVETEELREKRRTVFKNYGELLTAKTKDDEWQATVIRNLFDSSLYNADHWRKVGWLDKESIKNGRTAALPIVLKDGGGRMTIEPNRIGFDDVSAHNPAAIEHALMHVKQHWGGVMEIRGGDEASKAKSWAYAQIHGVKVANYAPVTPEAKAIADRILEEHKQQPAPPSSPRPASAPCAPR